MEPFKEPLIKDPFKGTQLSSQRPACGSSTSTSNISANLKMERQGWGLPKLGRSGDLVTQRVRVPK